MQTLTQLEFQAAFAHGAVKSVALEPVGSQFAVKFVTLTGEASLVQARGTQARLFGTTDSALKLLHKLGGAVSCLRAWSIGSLSGPPNTSAADPTVPRH